MNEDEIRAAAKLLAEAWQNMTTIEELPVALRPGSMEEAYAIQDEMAVLIGESTVGWKIGPASPGLMRARGFTEPGAGRLLESLIYSSPAELSCASIANPMLECELALRLTEDVLPRVQAYTASELESLAVLCPVFDVAGCRFTVPEANGNFDRVADMGGAGALVVGEEISAWRDFDFLTLPVDMRIDGGEPVANFEGDSRIDPLVVLVWLANFLSQRGIGLREGDLVSTGSATHAPVLYAGASAVASIPGLGELRLTMI